MSRNTWPEMRPMRTVPSEESGKLEGAEMVNSDEIVWLNGKLIPRHEANVNLLSPTSQFGANVFEGLRCYWNEQTEVLLGFRLTDHSDRLRRSIKLLGIDLEWRDGLLDEALRAVANANGYREDIAARAIVFVDGYGSWFSEGPAGVFVSAIAKGRHLRAGSKGTSCSVSTWRRIGDNNMSPRIKTGANYINSRMAQLEASKNGYDSALLLNEQGKLAEGVGSCVFIVRSGVLATPPLSASVLESITRDTVIELARAELGLRVEERDIDRTELYMADEAFLCGTSVEIVPITRVDRFDIAASGKPESLTARLLALYLDCARGRLSRYARWTTKVR